SGVAALGPDNLFAVSGSSFPAGQEVTLTIPGGEFLNQKVRIDDKGQFSTTVRLPESLPFGAYTIEVKLETECEHLTLTSADFVKAYSDSEDK
ncbi:MAG TPA: hypothetical protein VJT74_09240, partial [Pyrinomonadaceae bacterium]|nr:hypothetical protein [Pyrinomonadaceae bacterium]